MWLDPRLYSLLFALLVGGSHCDLGPKQVVYGQPVGVMTCNFIYKLEPGEGYPEWAQAPRPAGPP